MINTAWYKLDTILVSQCLVNLIHTSSDINNKIYTTQQTQTGQLSNKLTQTTNIDTTRLKQTGVTQSLVTDKT